MLTMNEISISKVKRYLLSTLRNEDGHRATRPVHRSILTREDTLVEAERDYDGLYFSRVLNSPISWSHHALMTFTRRILSVIILF
jgi:hypothetical protein